MPRPQLPEAIRRVPLDCPSAITLAGFRGSFPRLGITGVPGAGKTTLAQIIWHLWRRDDPDLALVHGDQIRPAHLVKVAEVIPRLIIEHRLLLHHFAAAQASAPPVILFVLAGFSVCAQRTDLIGKPRFPDYGDLFQEMQRHTETLTEAGGVECLFLASGSPEIGAIQPWLRRLPPVSPDTRALGSAVQAYAETLAFPFLLL